MLLLLSALAFADIPPPEGYVETCTVEKVQAENPGAECKSCDGWHGGREECEALEKEGFEAKCRTAGASTWTEVLCKGGSPAPTQPEAGDEKGADEPAPAPKKKDCNSAGGGGSTGLLVVALLALVGRRSR